MFCKVKIFKCIFLVLFVVFLAPSPIKECDGFKLRDLTAPDRNSEEKKSLAAGKSQAPQFRKIVKVVHVNDDGTELEEEFEFKFEKVHKTDFSKAKPLFQTIEEEEAKEEDKTLAEDTQKLSFSLSAMMGIFGLGHSEPTPPDSNGLINWLKSLKRSEADSGTIPAPQPAEPSGMGGILDNLFTYLDRWPFNLFIQFDKGSTTKSMEMEGHGDHGSGVPREPMTQEHFETLLTRLPMFILNASEIEDIECRKQLQIFHRQLRGHRLWTFQMLDSSAKITSGVLRGHINLFGDFDFCTNIKSIVKITQDVSVKIKGKYCLSHIDFYAKDESLKLPIHLAHGRGLLKSNLDNPSHFVPRYTTANLGVCIPNMCSSETIQSMLTNILKVYNSTGIGFRIQISEDDCFIKRSYGFFTLLANNWKVLFTLSFYLVLLIIVIAATILDNWIFITGIAANYLKGILKTQKPDEALQDGEEAEINESSNSPIPDSEDQPISLTRETILSFSMKRSIATLFSNDSDEDEISSLHAIKIIATFFIYIFLKFLMLGHLPITNRENLVKIFTYPVSIILRSPLLYLDTLLFVSGVLASYRCCIEMEVKSNIPVLRRFVGKLLRCFPTLFAVLYFQTWILPLLGSGPLWSNLVNFNSDLCEKNLWRNFFCAQNLVDLENTCSPLTIQYAVDFQLFLFAPLIVWLYYNNSDVGLAVYGALQAASVSARFYRSIQDRLSPILFHGMNLSQFYRTGNVLYASPLYRASPFLIGVGLGIFLRNSDKTIQLPKAAQITGWLSAVWSIFWCFWYPSNTTQIDFSYEPREAATYAAWAPILFCSALSWIIFVISIQDYESMSVRFLTSMPVRILSRISYPMQLVSYLVVIYSTAQTKDAHRFDISDFVNVREIVIIVSVSAILSVFLDIPMQSARKLLIEHEVIDTSVPAEEEEEIQEELEPIAEGTEDNTEDQQTNGETTCDNIFEEHKKDAELKDDIWGVEPKEEVVTGKLTVPYANNPVTIEDKGVTWSDESDHHDESWRTESDLEQQPEKTNSIKNQVENNEDEEDEEEIEISEEDEIVRRPTTPEESPKPTIRRRWDVDDD